MIKSIKGIYCTHVRSKLFISVHTKIVKGEPVLIENTAHCRYHTLHGCDIVNECERSVQEYDKWIRAGAML